MIMPHQLSSAATTFGSWNVKGLNHPKLKADIAYLQEMHLCQRDHTRLERDGFSKSSTLNSRLNAEGLQF